MAATDYATTLSVAGDKSPTALLTALEKRGAYVLADADDARQLSPGNALCLIQNGRLFRYDAADATSVHDGVTCLVSLDGRRFKADGFGGAQARFIPVQSKAVATPPASPSIGQSWIVAAGGTGAWAAKDKQIASYTARGWVFTVPNAYDMAWVNDEGLVYYYTAGALWASGFPGVTFGTNSISPSALKYLRFGLTVINQTTNAPPASPADGDAYIIGPSPTGAWASKARYVAVWEATAWVFYAPYNGAQVFDASAGAAVKYATTTATWGSVTGYANIAVGTKNYNALAAPNSNYAYSPTTAPTTANTTNLVTVNYAAKKANAMLEISFSVDGAAGPINTGTYYPPTALALGVFVDSTAAAAEWLALAFAAMPASGGGWSAIGGPGVFYITASDTASHAYSVRVAVQNAIGSGLITNFYGTRLTIKELS